MKAIDTIRIYGTKYLFVSFSTGVPLIGTASYHFYFITLFSSGVVPNIDIADQRFFKAKQSAGTLL